MLQKSLYHTFQRYRTLQTHFIKALPIVILMPHSDCNCRCLRYYSILNSETAVRFRKTHNMEQNETCRRCVCSLHLSPRLNPAKFS